MSTTQVFGLTLNALGTYVRLCVPEVTALEPAEALLRTVLGAIDEAVGPAMDPPSDLQRVHARPDRYVEVGPMLIELLSEARAAAEMSGGLVTPVRLRSPSLADHGSAWRSIIIDRARHAVLVPTGLEVDLSGILAGFAASHSARVVAAVTGVPTLVSIGGVAETAGPRLPGGWPINLSSPAHEGPTHEPPTTVDLHTGAIGTAAAVLVVWRHGLPEVRDLREPASGLSLVSPWRAVTVMSSRAVDASVLATTALVRGDGALAWLADRRTPARLIGSDGTILRVNGWSGERLEWQHTHSS